MTTTLTRNKMDSGAMLFPTQVKNETESLTYMKRLTAISVSNILYSRMVFPEEAYGFRKYRDMTLRILSEHSASNEASEVVRLVKGCFGALEKKYLKQIVIGIMDDPKREDDFVEAYVLRFKYADDNTSIGLTYNNRKTGPEEVMADKSFGGDCDRLMEETTQLLSNISLLTKSLEPLRQPCYLTMKLLYNEDTPDDYEPPGFKPSASSLFTLKGDPMTLTTGEVNTKYHSFKLRIRTDKSAMTPLAEVSTQKGTTSLKRSNPSSSTPSKRPCPSSPTPNKRLCTSASTQQRASR